MTRHEFMTRHVSMTRNAKIRTIALLFCAVALTAAHHVSQTESAMIDTANNFLSSLTPEQSAIAAADFNAEARTKWHFVPDSNFKTTHGFARPGLTFNKMDPHQQRLAQALLSTGLSQAGLVKALTIMSLEDVLRIKEKDTKGRRDPNKYYFSVYGKPSTGGNWGWRVEGHHLSLHFTLRNGSLVSSSPTFFGANPHKVIAGPRAGVRPLSSEEDKARELVKSLDSAQRKQAVIADIAPKDIITSADTRAKIEGAPQGLAASKMTAKQAEMLMALLDEYANNMPSRVAAARRKAVRDAPLDKVFFAWAGGIEQGQGDYYRVQGPTFLVEYDNTQNENNHSHTAWRDYENDFGFDVLASHHQLFAHGDAASDSYSAAD